MNHIDNNNLELTCHDLWLKITHCANQISWCQLLMLSPLFIVGFNVYDNKLVSFDLFYTSHINSCK